MLSAVSKDQFDWRGPASGRNCKPFSTKVKELFIPPPGEKVMPTASGMMLILIGLCIGLAAYNTENNILFAALALLLSTLVLSGLFCWMNFVSARWRMETSSTFRVGEAGEVAIVVENARRRFPLFCLMFELVCEETGEDCTLFLKESLAPEDSTRLVWRYRPKKRRIACFKLFDSFSTFPFGFLRKHVAGECEKRVPIWPARIDYRRLRTIGSLHGWQGVSTKSKGSTGELIGLRRYSSGDAPRSIHWKVSARQGKLMVKQNAAESQARYSILVDPSRYNWPSEVAFEKMCSFVVSLAEDLFLGGDLDFCQIIGGSTIKVSRVADLESFFDEIAALNWDNDLKERVETSHSRSIVFAPIDKSSVRATVNGVTIAQA